jgi:hypothetical protein
MTATDISMEGARWLAQAKANLSRFIRSQALATAELSGFAWVPDATAPSEYPVLRRAVLRSRLTGEPLPVSDEHSAETVYDSPETNYAFRFWHDMTHVSLDQNFELDAEITVARAHLAVLAASGWGPGTLEYELLHADTLGQALCSATSGDFPVDQPCFARRAVTSTLGEAIRAELGSRTTDDPSVA